MATNTYVALDKVTVGTATASITFSSIPQGYTDLVIVAAGTCSAGSYLTFRFNSDTGSNYSTTELYGDGTTAGSVRNSNNNYMYIGAIRTTQSNIINHIQNYSNSTTNKTVLSRTNNAATETKAVVGLWRNTAAITSIEVGTGGANTFQTGSTFSLYGIRAEGVSPAAKATGGAIYADSTYYYHVFAGSGTFTPTQSITADCLVVAGGGGGGYSRGGGGGAGGYRLLTSQSLTATGYSVTVGAGGSGSTGTFGGKGGNSAFDTISATGGGGGGAANATNAAIGGSGGGQSGNSGTGAAGNQGGYSPVEGYAGGNGNSGLGAAGGGGAGAVGANNASADGGAGGIGLSSASSWGLATGTGQNVSGTVYYAGGGGGGRNNVGTAAAGGFGGGGAGGATSNQAGNPGTAFTGGGGGGGANDTVAVNGGNGGSGIVIVRYAK